MAAKRRDQVTWMEWMAGDTYRELWKAVIRPSRHTYSPVELGPASFALGSASFERRDLTLKNGRGQALECSHWTPVGGERRPCVVFCHGNSSCRIETLRVLPFLLLRDVGVFSMDFSGSGLSEGEYISLGLQEEKDLAVAIRHLRRSGLVTSIGLWGRSMGAVTAALRASKDRCIAGCVLDSPFTCLRTVAKELVNQAMAVPQFVLDMALDSLRSECLSRADFDPDAVLPLQSAPLAKCPALFAVAQDDVFVLPHHTQQLHDAWGGERAIRFFGGGHNGDRPMAFLKEAAKFLALQLRFREGGGDGLMVVPLPSPRSSGEPAGSEVDLWLPQPPPVEPESADRDGAGSPLGEEGVGGAASPLLRACSPAAGLEGGGPPADRAGHRWVGVGGSNGIWLPLAPLADPALMPSATTSPAAMVGAPAPASTLALSSVDAGTSIASSWSSPRVQPGELLGPCLASAAARGVGGVSGAATDAAESLELGPKEDQLAAEGGAVGSQDPQAQAPEAGERREEDPEDVGALMGAGLSGSLHAGRASAPPAGASNSVPDVAVSEQPHQAQEAAERREEGDGCPVPSSGDVGPPDSQLPAPGAEEPRRGDDPCGASLGDHVLANLQLPAPRAEEPRGGDADTLLGTSPLGTLLIAEFPGNASAAGNAHALAAGSAGEEATSDLPAEGFEPQLSCQTPGASPRSIGSAAGAIVPPEAFSVRRTMRNAVVGAVRHYRRRGRVAVKRRAASERPHGAQRSKEEQSTPLLTQTCLLTVSGLGARCGDAEDGLAGGRRSI